MSKNDSWEAAISRHPELARHIELNERYGYMTLGQVFERLDALETALKPFADLILREWFDRDESIQLVRSGARQVQAMQLIDLKHVLTASDALIPPPRPDKPESDQDEDQDDSVCPDCGNHSVKPARGGGVKCTTKDCGYWFCY